MSSSPATIGPPSALRRNAPKRSLGYVETKVGPKWLYLFLAFEIICQVAQLTEALAPLRFFFRVASFAAGLLLLAALPGDSRRTPTAAAGLVVLSIVSVGVIHPTTNTILAGLAQVGMYLAVMSPLFWASRITISPKTFQRLLFMLWCFHLVSCIFGVLQVYFPGQFQPQLSSVLRNQPGYLESLQMTLDSGEKVFRPMGLTDIPGGVGMSGLYVLLLGSGFVLATKRKLLKLAVLVGMGTGAICIYLCQVRATAVMAGVCLLAIAARFFSLGRIREALGFAAVLPALAVLALTAAVSMGGQSVLDRFASLGEDSAGEVYYKNRGFFLEDTFTNLLPEHPIGAGLGRYGMMYAYFGDPSNMQAQAIHAEIQWTAWVLDGGVLLVLAYVVALTLAVVAAFRISGLRRQEDRMLSNWAAVLLGYDLGIIALTFSYIPFMAQMGMEFWLLNTMLTTAIATKGLKPAPSRLESPAMPGEQLPA